MSEPQDRNEEIIESAKPIKGTSDGLLNAMVDRTHAVTRKDQHGIIPPQGLGVVVQRFAPDVTIEESFQQWSDDHGGVGDKLGDGQI
ncbi:hypothetical protein [Azospirillum tabaci]|uniref:hypothetical protein n=1 Tax=Azospirillum tabaci TaxID=2752310 RepID=UPI001660B0E9|nr:hypothetical protein [Azospirillum tabaci]